MNELVGTGALIRLILRRDRIVMPIWILVVALLAVVTASAFAELYPTPELRQAFADQVANTPAEVALLGPVFTPSIGGLVAWRWITPGVLILGLASLITVVRHTRSEEETGRRELLGSTVVGRQAPLSAALIVVLGADLLMAVVTALGLIGVGLPIVGSVALGLSVAAVGWTVAAVAGVTAQLTRGAGAAKGMAAAVLGLFYVARALGDASGDRGGLSWLSWLSPIGWAERIRPYAGEEWAVFALFCGTAVLLIAAAYALSARRDLGAGVLPSRLGPATAAPGLRGPLALAWRLQRGATLAWIAGCLAIGTMLGYLVHTVASQLAASPQFGALLAQMGGQAGPGDALFSIFLMAFGPLVAIYAIQTVLRLRSEEVELRADPVLATSVSRLRWAASYLILAAAGSALVMTAFGVSGGLTYGLSSDSVRHDLSRVLAATIAYVPAVWVMAGIAMALFGLLPRLAAPVSWGTLSLFLLLELLGELQQVGQAVLQLSPFTHVPRLLLGGSSTAPLLWLVGIAAALSAAGLLGFQRRDVG